MINYDLCLAWNWEYDSDFVKLLDCACQSKRLSLLYITPDNLKNILDSLDNNRITFKVFFDRASDTDKRFILVDQWAHNHSVYRINARERASRSWNKATMHLNLINAGVHTPYTIIIPSYEEQPDLTPIDLSSLGDSFFIKPAHGSGGEGVKKDSNSFNQVLIARQEHPADIYLLQARIFPVQLDTRPAWFRIIYCEGQVYLSWWDIHTHIYTPVTPEEEEQYTLSPLRSISASIARLCGLELFSTEIALTPDSLFVVVDYVNDQIDLRIQSKTLDGVPDDIVCNIVERLVDLVALNITRSRM